VDDIPIIMCGSRTWKDDRPIWAEVERLIVRYGERLLIRHGDEKNGADGLIYNACETFGVRHIEYCAGEPRHEEHEGFSIIRASDWSVNGLAAGPIRNRAMRDAGAHGCVAFRSKGRSPGTDGMCELAREAGIPVIVYGG